MANPAPTINQINAFNATQGTIIDFNIIGGTELVRSNRIYIYDLSDNSLICTHLYVSTESIHELPPNTSSSIVYESGKSSADFVNGAQYYAQIQTFTDIAGTEGGSGLSVAKMFWCLVDPTLTITTVPSTISTTSYNVSATYDANTSVVSNIIQQYQFSLYSATGSLLQSSGVVVGSGTQQGTSTIYDISYNFTGLSVGSSYYVVVDVTTTQGMSVSVQSNTFTVSIDTPTLGEATVVNNACDGYISVTSNLSGEYGGSGSGEIVSFETDSENVFTKLQVDLDPIQDLHGYDKPWVGGAGKNLMQCTATSKTESSVTWTVNSDGSITVSGTATGYTSLTYGLAYVHGISGNVTLSGIRSANNVAWASIYLKDENKTNIGSISFGEAMLESITWNMSDYPNAYYVEVAVKRNNNIATNGTFGIQLEKGSTATPWQPYENICPISGHDEVDVSVNGVNQWDEEWEVGNISPTDGENSSALNRIRCKNYIPVLPNTNYYLKCGSGAMVGVFAYDAEKNYIGTRVNSSTWAPSSGTTDLGNIVIETPSNARFLKIKCIASYGTTYNNDISINYPSTDHEYHAYNGQSYTQEIEATYTPTVQENEPYQFKRTGDVGGDRESIELVGGSVAWNQLVQNGNFASDSNWSASNATKTINNGICTFTATAYNGNICTANPSRIFPSTANNHKYLVLAEVKLTTATTDVVLRLNGGYKEVKTASNTNWQTLATVYNLANSDNGYVQVIDKRTSGWDAVQVKTIIVTDLNQYFGSSTIPDYVYNLETATAGSGIAWLRKYYPKIFTYNPYNVGELKSVEGVSAHKTVGFNAWDEEWEVGRINPNTGENISQNDAIRSKNYIPCVPNTAYYYQIPSGKGNIQICFYDADKSYVGLYDFTTVHTFVTPSNCRYMRFCTGASYGTTYKNDICINLSSDRNGEYEPYVEHSYPLDDSLTLRGIPKLANGKLYYDGDTYESDGTVTRKWKQIDLDGVTAGKKFNGAFGAVTNGYAVYMDISGYSQYASGVTGLSNRFTYGVLDRFAAPLYQFGGGDGSAGICLFILPSTITSVAEANAWLQNNPTSIIVKLATPTTETAEPFENIQEVTPNYGTEEFVTTSIVPVGNNTQYYTREVYGGTVDVVSGVLTVTRVSENLDGTQAWSNFAEGTNTARIYFPSASLSSVMMPNATNTINIMTSIGAYAPDYIYSNDVEGISENRNAVANGLWVRVDKTKLYEVSANGVLAYLAQNPIQVVYELATPQTYQLTPQQIQTLVGQNNVWSEDGDVEITYNIPITNLLVKRQDVADVSGDWLTLYSQPITQASDMDFTFIDFLNQYGKTYKYALVPLLTQTQSGVEVEVEGGYTVSDEVQSVFDGVFIADSTGSQKCKANVGYGNVDMNQAVGTITPIGAKYPVVITNSQNQYHNGSISGTIVPDDYYFNGNLSRIDMVNKRSELEQFLTNKRAKIIKDWNGNIWLVMIMDNVSCTFNNNYGMGIVNFNTNWVEVGDPTNQEDLQATGLIDIGGV